MGADKERTEEIYSSQHLLNIYKQENSYFTTRWDFGKSEQIVTSLKNKVEITIVNIYWALSIC